LPGSRAVRRRPDEISTSGRNANDNRILYAPHVLHPDDHRPSQGLRQQSLDLILSLVLGWFPLVTIVCIIWAICAGNRQKQIAHAEILANAIAKAQRA
jgi:hypothetical protein